MSKDWETLAEDELRQAQEWSSGPCQIDIEANPLEVMRSRFGFQEYRGGQEEVINQILSGKDAFLVMPTGGGKSLCFQVPSVCLKGTTLVISPLIALMKDQVDSLTKSGIPSTFINSTLSDKEVSSRIDQTIGGRYKLVYIAPERVGSPAFMKSIPLMDIAMVAVDESHCISKWGHDFRPSYRKIPKILTKCRSRVPVIAVTATATPKVRDDIIRHLGMANPFVKVTGFRRPNLHLHVEHVSDSSHEIFSWARSTKEKGPFPPSIVYAGTRRDTQSITYSLRRMGIKCDLYHGGLDNKKREEVQNRFMSGEMPVVVATNAFGMGVDKSDIRYVMHATLPGSVEAYYQEVGRAGRDGEPSNCMMFFDLDSIQLQEYFIKTSHPDTNTAKCVYRVLKKLFERETTLNMTYKKIAQACQIYGRYDDREVGQTLTLLKRKGVFMAPKRGVMVSTPDHDPVDFGRFDDDRKEAEERLKDMIKFTKEKDLHKAILTYFDAEN
jgi:ATP-dependent DNA helicase RecQ